MSIRVHGSLLTIAATLVATASPLAAQGDTAQRGVSLSLNYGVTGRPGIAVLPLKGIDRAVADSIRAILQRDFDNGDRITVVGWNEADLPLVSGVPDFDVFARLNVHGIVQSTLTPEGALHIALYDTRSKGVANVDNFPLGSNVFSPAWRMAIHRAADEVERWATGVQGISATRIAFVRNDQIWVVDSDGENAVPVRNTSGGRSPAWHPSGQFLAFNVLTDAGSQLALHDVASGATRRLTSTTSGTSGSPQFSPDGMTLFYSFGLDRGSDLYAMDPFRGGRPRRVTAGGGSENISPSFSPDGRRFAFTSGRLINPEVYISDVDGTNTDLLITSRIGDQSYRSNPAWSPDGRRIAFQSQIDGRFQVMVISLQNREVKTLTSDSQNEDPSWAPDGRHLVFTSRRSGTDQLWVLDTESGKFRQLTRGTAAAKHSAWSPQLKGASVPDNTLITPARRER